MAQTAPDGPAVVALGNGLLVMQLQSKTTRIVGAGAGIASSVWRATWTACHPRCRCKSRRARSLPICRAKSPIGGRACEVWRVLLLSRGRSLAAESLPDCRADRRQQPCDAPACSRFSPTQGSGVTTTHCKHRKHVFGCPALPAALSSHLPAAVKRESGTAAA